MIINQNMKNLISFSMDPKEVPHAQNTNKSDLGKDNDSLLRRFSTSTNLNENFNENISFNVIIT